MKKNNLILGTFLAITAILFSSCAGGPTNVTDIDGNVYNVVSIGNQCWMKENLKVTHYKNGDVIPQVQDKQAWAKLTTGAWCYYNNDASNGTKYSKLYNWYAVHDPRGLAPNGYHIPTDEEWKKLTDYLGEESEAGTKMKSTSGWNNNGNGTNSSGFSGLPGGYRGDDGTFNYIGNYGYWWSSTDYNTYNAWFRSLNYFNGNVYRYVYFGKENGFSVRCLRN